MTKTYSVREKISEDLVEQLLHNRGIESLEAQRAFLNPDFTLHLHDPFLLPGMEAALSRIEHAFKRGEKIGIWSDYDADGIPGGALLHDFFKLVGFSNFINYIPDRLMEGYGLNKEGIDEMKKAGVTLLITIDCGIRDIEHVVYAKQLGLDTIITDHHEPGEVVPEAFAIVNHKLKDSIYPERVLCGSGVVWKLIEAFLSRNREKIKPGQEKWLLDLAGLATLSDMVPLTGENRALAHFGLKVLRQTKRPGLKKLYKMLKINPMYLTEDDIGFLITPRINAASRMGKPRDAFDLLTATDEGVAEATALHLDAINGERKVVVAGIVKEALKMVRAKFEHSGEKAVIVAGNPSWRPSLLGLAANSIAEEFRRPVFLWGRENGNGYKGSCRSYGGADLVALMEKSKHVLTEFGGHTASGGFSLEFEHIPLLEEALIDAAVHSPTGLEAIHTDSILSLHHVHEETARSINQLAPFGTGNEKPLFTFLNVIPEKIDRFGKNKEHLSVTLREGGKTTKAISFFTTPDAFGDNLKEGLQTNAVAHIEQSFFMNRPEVRLRIVDFFR